MQYVGIRRGVSILLVLLLVFSLCPKLMQDASAASTDYSIKISSNIAFSDVESSTSNPYLVCNNFTATKVNDTSYISDSYVDTTVIYSIRLKNLYNLDGATLSKVIINGTEVNVPTASASHAFEQVSPSPSDIEGTVRIRNRNGTASDSTKGITIQFQKVTPAKDIEVSFVFDTGRKYSPTFSIAGEDEEKARIIPFNEDSIAEYLRDTDEGSVYRITMELITSPYDDTVGCYDLDYYTIGENPTRNTFNLNTDNYIWEERGELVQGYEFYDEVSHALYFVRDPDGPDAWTQAVGHYYITTTVTAVSDEDIYLHFCPGWMELSLVNYEPGVFAYGEWIWLNYIGLKDAYENELAKTSVPLIAGMDGYFTVFVTAHGLNAKTSQIDDRIYNLKVYNGENTADVLVQYEGIYVRGMNRPYPTTPVPGLIRFTMLNLPETSELGIELDWNGFHLSTTANVQTASDIPQVKEFKTYYQSVYGMDKQGRALYTEQEKASEDYTRYIQYSPYRYALRNIYNEQIMTIATASASSRDAVLEAAEAMLDTAGRGENCDTVLWTFLDASYDGTTARPIIAAMPGNYSAHDAIIAALEAEWPGNWTYTYTFSQFGAFVTYITAGGNTDTGSVASSTGYHNYAFFYYNDKFSEWGVSNYYPSDGDVMVWDPSDNAVLDSEFTWVWGILRWKLGDDEIERVLTENNIAYESEEFFALGADGLAALFPESNYPDVTWCQYGQFSRYGQLKELGPEAETIRLINAIGAVSPQSGPAITAARNAYDALSAADQAKVTNYIILTEAEAIFAGLTQITDINAVRNGIMASLASDSEAIGVRSINGEWKLLALARDGRITSSSDMAQNYLLLLDRALDRGDTVELVTDYERVTLALSALGIDAAAFQYDDNSQQYDLTEPFTSYDADMLLNQKIFALLALNTKPYTGEAEEYVSGIVAEALPGGGWNLSGVGSAEADMTAMAIQALAPYYETDADVKAAIDDGLDALKAMQDQDGGGFYGMGQYNSCSVAQVIVALCSLGIDPTGEEWSVGDSGQYNPVTALCQFYIEDEDDSSKGMIKYTLNASAGDDMSTEQAAYALAAYNRFMNNKDTLYDMSALFTAEANAAALAELKTTLESADWTVAQADAEDGTAAKTAAEAILADMLPNGVTAELSITNHTAAIAGTKENENGTNGKYSFTIQLVKGSNEALAEATATITDAVITATKYHASQDDADLDALKGTLEGMIWTLAQADAEDATAAKAAVEAKLTEELLNGAVAAVTVSSFDAAIAGTAEDPDGTDGSYEASIALSKGEAALTVTVTGTITATGYVDPSSQITVTFRLVGAYLAEQNVDLSKSDYIPDYVTWIPTKTYTIDKNSTMYDLFTMAMSTAGLSSIGADNGYVKTIYAPDVLTGYKLSEFTNGKRSGWMYTVNGTHPSVGLTSYIFADDESVMASNRANVVWHYVNDYAYEVEDWSGGTSLGNASIWNKWLDAADTAPTAVSATSIELDKTSTSVAPGSTATLTATVLPSYALDKTVTWTSSNDEIATVNAEGVVTGVAEGNVIITASHGSLSATCEVTVSTIIPVPDDKIDITGEDTNNAIADVTSEISADGTATLHVTAAKACVVVVEKADGTYERLTAVQNDNGGYDFSQEGYTEAMKFHVLLKGDADENGEVTITDAMLLAKACLSETHSDHWEASDLISTAFGNIDLIQAMLIVKSCLSSNHESYLPLTWLD